jgi:hypothetical protein
VLQHKSNLDQGPVGRSHLADRRRLHEFYIGLASEERWRIDFGPYFVNCCVYRLTIGLSELSDSLRDFSSIVAVIPLSVIAQLSLWCFPGILLLNLHSPPEGHATTAIQRP